MRISDWSSVVCSSDLYDACDHHRAQRAAAADRRRRSGHRNGASETSVPRAECEGAARDRVLMRRYGLLTLAALVGGAGVLWAAAPAPSAKKAPAIPERIVSINLCADQLVLALDDREQIAGPRTKKPHPEIKPK